MTNKHELGFQTRCQICDKTGLTTILELGHHPLPSAYLDQKGLHEPETTYPLNMCLCSSCGLVQLDYIVDPVLVFPPEYPYQSGMTNMLVRNFQSLADTVVSRYVLAPGSLIVDIGSNDGSLLRPFHEQGMRVLGIEPTDVAKLANQRGIETVQDYLSPTVAQTVVAKHGRATVVTASNVFAHIPDPQSIVESIAELLAEDGLFVSESQYLFDIVTKLEFDTIYHEHLRFYSLKPLLTLFSDVGMSIVDAERIEAAGGSIRVYAKKGKHPSSDRVQALLDQEEKAGLSNLEALRAFAERALSAKRALMTLLQSCRAQGRMVGIGAPVRGNTLLNFTRVDTSILEYTCEREGSPKIGLFTPGVHIPVVDERRLLEENPPYAMILSWHIGDELVKKLREIGYRGSCIIPLPEPRIIPGT